MDVDVNRKIRFLEKIFLLPMGSVSCITVGPASVYETIHGQPKPANPSNCLHCKTCQRKCPFDNIRWTAPEGGGGPRYKRM